MSILAVATGEFKNFLLIVVGILLFVVFRSQDGRSSNQKIANAWTTEIANHVRSFFKSVTHSPIVIRDHQYEVFANDPLIDKNSCCHLLAKLDLVPRQEFFSGSIVAPLLPPAPRVRHPLANLTRDALSIEVGVIAPNLPPTVIGFGITENDGRYWVSRSSAHGEYAHLLISLPGRNGMTVLTDNSKMAALLLRKCPRIADIYELASNPSLRDDFKYFSISDIDADTRWPDKVTHTLRLELAVPLRNAARAQIGNFLKLAIELGKQLQAVPSIECSNKVLEELKSVRAKLEPASERVTNRQSVAKARAEIEARVRDLHPLAFLTEKK